VTKPTGPFAAFEWMIALRYLRAKRQESFISIISIFSLLGIALGVATLIIVMSVMNGFGAELLDRILGLNGHIVVQSDGGQGLPDFDAKVARLRALPGVLSAVPIVEGQVLANSSDFSSGALVRGLRPEDLEKFKGVSASLTPQAKSQFREGQSVIVGSRLAEKLGLAPGMMITLVAPRGAVTPFGTTPRVKTYRIAGTFQIGMSEYDQTFVFMPLEEAQLFFGLENKVGGIEIMVTDANAVDRWLAPVRQAVGDQARITTWQGMNSSLFSALQVERVTMFLILTMIILVAALNIISGLIMLVKDKSGDIAILRTMGAGQGSIMRVFFIAGAFIGVVGTILGVVGGLVFCANIESIRQFLTAILGVQLFDPEIYFLSHIPSKVELADVLAVTGMALGLSLFATLYPSWRASRLDPVEALRYE
jgi:lipoprotein-releasing system permease protein